MRQKPMSSDESYQYWNKLWSNIACDLKKLKLEVESLKTDEQIESLALKSMLSDELEREKEAEMIRKYKKQHAPSLLKSQMITLCVHQGLSPEDTVAAQRKLMDSILGIYCFTKECAYTFEYFTEESGWNPHIHVVVPKIKSDGYVAQQLRRKNLENCYRIDVKTLSIGILGDYINGIKVDEKMEYVAKDIEFRQKHNLLNNYSYP